MNQRELISPILTSITIYSSTWWASIWKRICKTCSKIRSLDRPDYDYLGLGSKMCTIQSLNLTKTIYALKWSKLIRKSNFGYEIYVKFSKFLRGWVHFFKKLDIFTENRDFSTMWPKKSRKKLIFSLKIDFFQKIANFLKKPTPPRENIENFTQFS